MEGYPTKEKGGKNMPILKGKDILHGNQFTKKDIEEILKVA
jgi:hypothetical protein